MITCLRGVGDGLAGVEAGRLCEVIGDQGRGDVCRGVRPDQDVGEFALKPGPGRRADPFEQGPLDQLVGEAVLPRRRVVMDQPGGHRGLELAGHGGLGLAAQGSQDAGVEGAADDRGGCQ